MTGKKEGTSEYINEVPKNEGANKEFLFTQEKAESMLYYSLGMHIQEAVDDINDRVPFKDLKDALMNSLARSMIGVIGIGDLKNAVNQSIRYLHKVEARLKDPRIEPIEARKFSEMIERMMKGADA